MHSADLHLWFHHRLNPKLWQNTDLRLAVRLKLLATALSFYQFLEIDKLRVKDIILTGSNAAYNYTPLSDIDVHLVVAYNRTTCPDLAENFFTTKKSLWNQTYNIAIYEQPVELYVEDFDRPVTANGVFSLLHNEWLKRPSRRAPTSDDLAVRQKTAAYVAEIDDLLNGQPTIQDINHLVSKLRTLRQNGLMTAGEFSTENLTFKSLRNRGYLQQLYDLRTQIRDRELSL